MYVQGIRFWYVDDSFWNVKQMLLTIQEISWMLTPEPDPKTKL